MPYVVIQKHQKYAPDYPMCLISNAIDTLDEARGIAKEWYQIEFYQHRPKIIELHMSREKYQECRKKKFGDNTYTYEPPINEFLKANEEVRLQQVAGLSLGSSAAGGGIFAAGATSSTASASATLSSSASSSASAPAPASSSSSRSGLGARSS